MIKKILAEKIEEKYNKIINETRGTERVQMIFERSIYICNKNSFKTLELLKILGKLSRFKKDNKSEDPYDFPAMGWLSWKIFRI